MWARAHGRTGRLLAVGLGMLAISVPGLACGGDGDSYGDGSSASTTSTTAAAETAPGTVDTFDFGFDPAETTVKVGDTVTWENSGETIHTVKGPGFFSDGLDTGDSYEHKFTKPGTYDYICTLHPDQMQGTVVVEK
ncbi:MAG TPA: plastocyanin/azurin family copper-binding protein [Solirubrobacterales bacterium]|nr:plastocyanin/azurin family copper-binding protein [Solirubrobacterales bacterium]